MTTTRNPAADDREQYRVWALRASSTRIMGRYDDYATAAGDAALYPGMALVTRLPGQEWEDGRPAPTGPGEYTVTWTHDAIDADSPEDAARQALETHRDPGSIACVYDVTRTDGTSRTVEVDLNAPEEVDGPIRERPLPVELEQLTDEMLTRVIAEADRILAARRDAVLPAAILAAWDREHRGAPQQPASVTLTANNVCNGGYWDTRTAAVHFADGTTHQWDIRDQDARHLLRQHEDDTEPDEGDRLTVTFDPPTATVQP